MSALEMFLGLPPVARTITATAFGMSVLVYTKILPYYWIMFTWPSVLTVPPQLWRFVTSFLLTGPGLGLIFDPFLLYRALCDLEVGNARFSKREDLVWYLICVSLMTIGFNEIGIYFSFSHVYATFFQGFAIALAYTSSQDQRGMKVNLFFFSIPAQLMPYAMILIGFLQNAQAAMFYLPLQVSGILAAHMFDFLTRLWPEFGDGRSLLPTPGFVSYLTRMPTWLQGRVARATPGSGSGRVLGGGSAGSSTGVRLGNGPLPDSWKTRGPGQRLG